MCYDHLGGAVGVAITDALTARGLISDQDGGYLLGPDGAHVAGDFSGPPPVRHPA